MRESLTLTNSVRSATGITGFVPDTITVHNYTGWYLYLRQGDQIPATLSNYHLLVPPMSFLSFPTSSQLFSASLGDPPRPLAVNAQCLIVWTANETPPAASMLRHPPITWGEMRAYFETLPAPTSLSVRWTMPVSSDIARIIPCVTFIIPPTTSPGQVRMELQLDGVLGIRLVSTTAEQTFVLYPNWLVSENSALTIRASNSDSIARAVVATIATTATRTIPWGPASLV